MGVEEERTFEFMDSYVSLQRCEKRKMVVRVLLEFFNCCSC